MEDFYETLTPTKFETTVICSYGSCDLIMDAQDAEYDNDQPYCWDHYEVARDLRVQGDFIDQWLKGSEA